jgi:hypothetical protein
MRDAVAYLRLNQGWSMFAPDAPRSDLTVVVDAATASGRHLDPYNAVGSLVADPRARSVPARLGHDALFCEYTARVPGQQNYDGIFAEWILAHHRRTRRRDDRIVRFDAYIVEQDSPPPGQTLPTNVRTRRFLSRDVSRRLWP